MALIREESFNFFIEALLSTETAPETPETFATDRGSPRVHSIAYEADPIGNFSEGDFVGMKPKFQPIMAKLLDLMLPAPKLIGIWAEQNKIIHVANIVRNPEPSLDELIERIQVEIRKELACEIADGDSDISGGTSEQGIGEAEKFFVTDAIFDQFEKHIAPDRVKIFCYVQL